MGGARGGAGRSGRPRPAAPAQEKGRLGDLHLSPQSGNSLIADCGLRIWGISAIDSGLTHTIASRRGRRDRRVQINNLEPGTWYLELSTCNL